jgi:acetone carboxylase gamma subunit
VINIVFICNKCKKEIISNTPSYSFCLCRNCFKERIKEINRNHNSKIKTIFQSYIHEKIKANSTDSIITYKTLKGVLIRSHIPLPIQNTFIKEMEQRKLIKKINKNIIKVL